MNKRYFYDDLGKALYMASNFRIKIYIINEESDCDDDFFDFGDCMLDRNMVEDILLDIKNTKTKFYIKKESEDLIDVGSGNINKPFIMPFYEELKEGDIHA